MKHARPDYNRIQDPEGRIPAEEPVFLLRAQDETAAATLRFWASLNESRGGDYALIKAAREQAERMDAWPTKKLADHDSGQS